MTIQIHPCIHKNTFSPHERICSSITKERSDLKNKIQTQNNDLSKYKYDNPDACF